MTKKITSVLFGLLIVLSLVGNVSAQSGDRMEGNQDRKENATNAAFCEKISERLTRSQEKLTERLGRLENSHSQRNEGRDAKWNDFFTRRDDKRTTRDSNLEEHFAMLEDRGVTDEQKQAITDFIAAIRAAIEARRIAFDEANSDFRWGVGEAIDARDNAIETAIAIRTTAWNTAIEKAKADCLTGVDAKQIRENLANDTKTATEAFKSAVNTARENFKTAFDALKETKNSALNTTKETFRTAVEEAKNKLKQVIGNDDDSDGDSGDNNESSTDDESGE